MRPMRPASATSSATIRRREPPIARLIPISRVRSLTDIAIVLTTDRPPTIRLMRPTPTMIPPRRFAIEPIDSSNSLAVTVGHVRQRRFELRRRAADVGTGLRVDDDVGDRLRRRRGFSAMSAGRSLR